MDCGGRPRILVHRTQFCNLRSPACGTCGSACPAFVTDEVILVHGP